MWFYLSLIFALGSSVGVSINKKVLKNTDPLVYLAFGQTIGFIANGLFIYFFIKFSQVDSIFWQNVAIAAFIGIFLNIAYFNAIKKAPISLLAPMSAVTPLVATISGFLFLSEHTSSIKFFGILLIVVGAYLLSISEIKKGIIAPFKSLFRQKGVVLMLFAQAMVGVTPAFEKTAILHTNPVNPMMTSWVELGIVTLCIFPLMLRKSKYPVRQFRKNFWWYIFPVPLALFLQWSAFTAYSQANIGYVVAIFKLSILFTIILGGLFFKEQNIRERFIGALVMIIGTVLLAI